MTDTMMKDSPPRDPLLRLLNDVRRLVGAGRIDEARHVLAESRKLQPDTAIAWRAIAEAWRMVGDRDVANEANLRAIALTVREPDMVDAAKAMAARDDAEAERILRERIARYPSDAAALAMLGDVLLRMQRFEDAEPVLARAIDLAPGFRPARQSYAFALYSRSRIDPALAQIAAILATDATDFAARDLKAALLSKRGDEEDAIALHRTLIAEFPERAVKSWLQLGHALKAVGRTDEGIAAYRTALARGVSVGETYWSLANLKTFRFADTEIADMHARLAAPATPDADRAPIAFALGKAMEDAGNDTTAFELYAQGNRLRRATSPYDPAETTDLRRRCEAVFDADFFANRPGGCPSPEPIFIVGLPRSGSTLIEQIIASHPLVENTRELPFLIGIAQHLDQRKHHEQRGRYPEVLRDLSPEQRYRLGREYLDRAQAMRRTGTPYFIDKLPNNFLHVGLIQLILPNARIVDARRHPMATGFSGFKQYFARHQQFTYDLDDLGRYYVDYVRVMQTFDIALPGRVYRVIHEHLISDVEGEVHALLDYLHLPFDSACLRPHENRQAVRTPSAEQVRQPINAAGTEQWRRFAPWLDPLETALGPVLDAYPAVPDFPRA